MRIQGKRVLVTGGTAGIGWALSRALLGRSARVFICGRDPARLDHALEHLPGAVGSVCDLGHREGMAELLEDCVAELGGLDILINNAGIQQSLDFTNGIAGTPEMLESIGREIAVNLTGPIQLTWLALPHLARGDEPAVVNVTSILAYVPRASSPVYCATKAALRSITASLRSQLDPLGIRAVDLVPPLVDTAMTQGRDEGKKLSADEFARSALAGLEAEQDCILVGRAKQASWLARLAPALLARKLSGDTG